MRFFQKQKQTKMSTPKNKSVATVTDAKANLLQKYVVAIVLGLCGIGVIAISQFLLINQSLRLDEGQSIWQTSHSFTGMLQVIAQDVHMPLYHTLLHFWIGLFGNGVETVRSLSLLFFLLSIPVVYLLARKLLSWKWSLFATVLFSFSPFMNWYANETRMYTLLVLFSVLNQYYFVSIMQSKKGWIGYALTAVIGAYSHYFFIFNLIAQAVFYLTNRGEFAKNALKKFIVVAGLLIVALSPWIAYFVSQGSASNTRPMLAAPSTVDFFNAFSQFMFGFQNDTVNTILVSSWPLLVIAAFFMVKRHLRFNHTFGYFVTAALLPVLLAFLLSYLVTPFFLSRYMVAVIPPLYIASVWFISRFSRNYSIAVASLCILLLGLNFNQQVESFTTPVKEDYRGVVESINDKVQPQDVIVLSSPFTTYPVEYYYDGPAQIKTLPIWNREVGSIPTFDSKKLPSEVNTLKQGHRDVYLILSYDQGYEEEVKTYFENNFERVDFQQFSSEIDLYVYRVGYDTVPSIDELSIR